MKAIYPTLQQLADHARWHMGDENLLNDEALKALASDVNSG